MILESTVTLLHGYKEVYTCYNVSSCLGHAMSSWYMSAQTMGFCLRLGDGEETLNKKRGRDREREKLNWEGQLHTSL